MNSVRAVPVALLRHGQTAGDRDTGFGLAARRFYPGPHLFDHQQQASEVLGFARMSEHQRRALVRVCATVAHTADRERLLLWPATGCMNTD